MQQIPQSITALTTEWLTLLFKKHGYLETSRLVSFHVDRTGLISGFFGDIARLKMVFEGANSGLPSVMLAKFPTEEQGAYGIGLERGYYEREARFYTELGDACGIRVPKCYASAVSQDGRSSLLLLEDLSLYRPASVSSDSPYVDAISVMAELGEFHAKSWAETNIDDLTWLPGTSAGADRFKNDFGVAWQILCEILGDDQSNYSSGRKIIEYIPKIKHLLEQPPRVFLHADLRDENIFFDDDQYTKMIVIDWQHCRKGRSPFDVATYMFGRVGTMDIEDEGLLIDRYYRSLLEAGIQGYSPTDCMRDYYLAMVDRFVNVGSTLAKVSPDSDGGKTALEYLARCGLGNFIRYSELLLPSLE